MIEKREGERQRERDIKNDIFGDVYVTLMIDSVTA